MNSAQAYNSSTTIAWLLLTVVIVALSILTVDLIVIKVRKNRIKKNDNHIFKATREARRDFR